MTVHEVKSWPAYFERVWTYAKKAELRRDDRGYVVGDLLYQREWSPDTQTYTGRTITHVITDIVRGTEHLALGYAMLSLGDMVEIGEVAP